MTVALALGAPSPEPAPPTRLRVLPAQPPRTRADCEAVPRPCPFSRCRYHLDPERVRWRADQRPITSPASCALDVADQGGASLGEIGHMLGVSRERVRQIQIQAVENLAEGLRLRGLLTSGEAMRVPGAVREALSP